MSAKRVKTIKLLIAPGIPESETCVEFFQGQVDRMGVSFCKYGLVADAYPNRVDAIASLHQRLVKYAETGNTEWLMDVANYAMIEFMHPRHPQAHFRGTDSRESPGRVFEGAATDRRNDAEVRKLYQREGD